MSGGLIAAALRRARFEVNEQSNLSNGRIAAAISDFSDAVAGAPETVAVVYACGYAVDFERRAFLLPVTSNLERPTDVLSQGLLERQIVNAFAKIPVQAGLLLFDTWALPGSQPQADSALDFSAVAQAGQLGNWGFIGAHGTVAQPSGSSALVNALTDQLAEPTLEVSSLIHQWQTSASATPGLISTALVPDKPAWLNGGPLAPQAIAAPAPAATAKAGQQDAALSATLNEADKRRIQLALARLGYYTGHVDGQYGAATTTAIRRYQQESGNEATGILTQGEAAALLRDGH
jgi:hypothetical protein